MEKKKTAWGKNVAESGGCGQRRARRKKRKKKPAPTTDAKGGSPVKNQGWGRSEERTSSAEETLLLGEQPKLGKEKKKNHLAKTSAKMKRERTASAGLHRKAVKWTKTCGAERKKEKKMKKGKKRYPLPCGEGKQT